MVYGCVATVYANASIMVYGCVAIVVMTVNIFVITLLTLVRKVVHNPSGKQHHIEITQKPQLNYAKISQQNRTENNTCSVVVTGTD
jgi:hypothetical protein